MNKLNFGTVNKIFLDFEFPFLSPDISEIILLWDRIDEKSVPISERWFRKVYSFSKVSETLLVNHSYFIDFVLLSSTETYFIGRKYLFGKETICVRVLKIFETNLKQISNVICEVVKSAFCIYETK